MGSVYRPVDEDHEICGPFHVKRNARAHHIIMLILHVVMVGLMVGLGAWEISMFNMNRDLSDTESCKVATMRNVMLANGIIDVLTAAFSLVSIIVMLSFIPLRISTVTGHILSFLHSLLMLSSLGLMITNSSLTWAGRCNEKDSTRNFYNMLSTMYIVMWSLMGGYVLSAIVLTVIAKGIDIRRGVEETRYVALNAAD